jgi:hypothetical protein
MRRGVFILAGFGYVMFLVAGLDTGSGVYRTPGYGFAALAFAVVGAALPAKRQTISCLALYFIGPAREKLRPPK